MGMCQSTTVPTVEGTYFVAGQDAVKWDSPDVARVISLHRPDPARGDS